MNLKVSGIYEIWHETTKRSYVGSSVDLTKRYRQHLYLLSKGKHHNHLLQEAYQNYPQESFRFSILECCEPRLLMERENYWIEEKHSFTQGMNLVAKSANTGHKKHIKKKKPSLSEQVRDICEQFRVLIPYKDAELSGEILVGFNCLNIVPTSGDLSILRLKKVAPMLLAMLDQIYSLPDGTYKISHVNYLEGKGNFKIAQHQGNTGYVQHNKTNAVYDSLISELQTSLNYSKLGRKVLKEMDSMGIYLNRMTEEIEWEVMNSNQQTMNSKELYNKLHNTE